MDRMTSVSRHRVVWLNPFLVSAAILLSVLVGQLTVRSTAYLLLLVTIPLLVGITMRPQWGILLLIPAFWFNLNHFGSYEIAGLTRINLLTPTKVIVSLILLGFLLKLGVQRRFPNPGRFFWIALLFMMSLRLGYLVYGFPGRQAVLGGLISSFFTLILLFLLLGSVDSPTVFKGFCMTMIVSSVLLAVLGFSTPVRYNSFVTDVTRTEQKTNLDFVFFLAITMPFMIAYFRALSTKLRYALIFPICLVGAAMTLSGQKSAVVSLAVVAVLTLRHRKARLATMGILALLVLMYLGTVQVGFSPGAFAWIKEDQSISGRLATPAPVFELFSQSPLVGVGLGNYQLDPVQDVLQAAGASHKPHIYYLLVLLEGGVVGVMLLAYLLFAVYEAMIRVRRQLRQTRHDPLLVAFSDALFDAYVLVLVILVFQGAVLSTAVWFIFSLIIALDRIVSQDSIRDNAAVAMKAE